MPYGTCLIANNSVVGGIRLRDPVSRLAALCLTGLVQNHMMRTTGRLKGSILSGIPFINLVFLDFCRQQFLHLSKLLNVAGLFNPLPMGPLLHFQNVSPSVLVAESVVLSQPLRLRPSIALVFDVLTYQR